MKAYLDEVRDSAEEVRWPQLVGAAIRTEGLPLYVQRITRAVIRGMAHEKLIFQRWAYLLIIGGAYELQSAQEGGKECCENVHREGRVSLT